MDLRCAGNEDAEAILEDRIAIDRKGTIGQAMKGVIAIDNAASAGGTAMPLSLRPQQL